MERLMRNYLLKEIISQSPSKTVQIAKVQGNSKQKIVLWIYDNEEEPNEIHNLRNCQNFETNFIEVKSTWTQEGKFYACVEYFELRDLKHFKTYFTKEVIPFELILNNCCRITAALAALHNNNYSHNNLKSSKILINSERLVSLSGFNLLRDESINNIKSGKNIAFINDIKNLGRVFCEMASIKIPDELSFKRLKKLQHFDEKFLKLVFAMLAAESLDSINTTVIMEEVSCILQDVMNNKQEMKKSITSEKCLSDQSSLDLLNYSTIKTNQSYIISRNTTIKSLNSSNISNPNEDSEYSNPYIKTDYETDIPCVLCQSMLFKPGVRCSHSYHLSCFKDCIKATLKNVKSKRNPIKCFRQECEKLIPFDFIINKFEVHEKIHIISTKLMYSSLEYICNCGFKPEPKIYCLNEQFKRQNYRCLKCDIKYCTLCGLKGGHHFSCSSLNELEKRFKKRRK